MQPPPYLPTRGLVIDTFQAFVLDINSLHFCSIVDCHIAWHEHLTVEKVILTLFFLLFAYLVFFPDKNGEFDFISDIGLGCIVKVF